MTELEKTLTAYGFKWVNLRKGIEGIKEAIDWATILSVQKCENEVIKNRKEAIARKATEHLFVENGLLNITDSALFAERFNMSELFKAYPTKLLECHILIYGRGPEGFRFKIERFIKEKVKEIYGDNRFDVMAKIDPPYKMESLFNKEKADLNMTKRMQLKHNQINEELKSLKQLS